MENLFSGLRAYAGKWEVASVRKLNETEKSMFRKAEIVSSDYGNSCCFFMTNGTQMYIPMDSTYEAKGPGESLDIDKIEVVKLTKPSETPIQRIREAAE